MLHRNVLTLMRGPDWTDFSRVVVPYVAVSPKAAEGTVQAFCDGSSRCHLAASIGEVAVNSQAASASIPSHKHPTSPSASPALLPVAEVFSCGSPPIFLALDDLPSIVSALTPSLVFLRWDWNSLCNPCCPHTSRVPESDGANTKAHRAFQHALCLLTDLGPHPQKPLRGSLSFNPVCPSHCGWRYYKTQIMNIVLLSMKVSTGPLQAPDKSKASPVPTRLPTP